MSERVLRFGIIILAIFASVVHFYLAVSSFMQHNNSIDALTALWLLNAVGYLCLLAAYLGVFAFFRGEDSIGFSLIAYAVVTMIAWWAIDPHTGALGWITAADETLLVVALIFHMRVRPKPEPEPDSY